MKFSAENDLNDLKQWLQENEMYAENQGVSKGDSLETTDAQNYNPLRDLKQRFCIQIVAILLASKNLYSFSIFAPF